MLTEEKAVLTAETEAKSTEIAALSTELTTTSNQLAATTDELTQTQSTLSSTQTTMVDLLSQHVIGQGFNGPITVSAIINSQGAIAYLTVDASGETEGIGQKVMDTEYLVQFLGKTLPLTLGTDVEAVSGATVTSQAVVDALNLLATDYDNAHAATSMVSQSSVSKQKVYVQNVPGYESNVKVVVYVAPGGQVTDVKVYADGETNGAAVMENAFTNQFVGRSADAVMGVDVDAVTGATTTSQAVVDAVNNITK